MSGREHVLQLDAATRPDTGARLLDALQKSRVILKPIVKPVVFRFEPDQHPGWLAVARDDNLLRLCLSQEAREIVFDRGERDFLHLGFPYRASHDSASILGMIANTSIVEPETS